jgi:hypothetical protein
MKHNNKEDYFKNGDVATDSGEDTSSYWGEATGEDA